jgi:NADH dehydrogenase [ubiquinone] 1 alpha subcomplex assembly factor 7
VERLDAFMARANAAYYAAKNPFADFTTAPEISQVFGEVLGLWAAETWQAMGAPDPVLLAEAGPGRGTLMADALRAIRQVAPAFGRALRLHLVEISARLRAEQAARLPGAAWHDRVEDVPPGPLLLLANEFLDALPIRQFVFRGAGWAERFVEEGRFVDVPYPLSALGGGEGWGEVGAAGTAPTVGGSLPMPCRPHHPPHPNPLPPQARAEREHHCPPEGTIMEHPEAALTLISALAARLAATGGAALFLDYGPEHSAPGDSLQALRDKKPADPLAEPGSADLTAHVDFSRLAEAARAAGAAVFGPLPQGVLLVRLGLFQRTGALARKNPARAGALQAAAARLAEPDRMGRLFKAMAVCHPALPTPAGFAA